MYPGLWTQVASTVTQESDCERAGLQFSEPLLSSNPPSGRGFSLNLAPKNADRLKNLSNVIFLAVALAEETRAFLLRVVHVRSPES